MSQRVIVVGAGFAGLRAVRLLARQLRQGEAELILVDRTGLHTLRPKIPQAMGGRIPCAVQIPVAPLLPPGVKLVVGEVSAIDPQARAVQLGDRRLEGDILVLALGAEPSLPASVAACDPPLPVWSFDQACSIRRRVEFLARAARQGRPVDVSVAVIGGGFIGTEVAAELQARLVRLGGEAWRGKVLLLERAERLLPRLAAGTAAAAARHLSRLGVQIITGAQVQAIHDGQVLLADGRTLKAGTVVWTAGTLRAPQVAASSGLADQTGRIPVLRTLESVRYPGVFAMGDAAYMIEGGQRASEPSAHRAEQEAETVAHNVVAQLRGQPLRPHRASRPIYLLGLGPNFGVLDAGPGLRLAGRLPAWLKELVIARHLWQLGGWTFLRRTVRPVVWAALAGDKAWDSEPLPGGMVCHHG